MSNDENRRPSIRPVSREPKKAANALQECRCFEEVDRRVRMGWASTDLTKFVQEENEELTHLSAGYVKSMIDKYRNSIPPAELLLTVQNNAVVSRNATMKISNGLEELAELNKLYDLQMERINIDVTSEKKVGKLFKETGREIFYAMKILKQSSDLKMDLGIAKRQLGEVSINGQAAVQIGDRYNGNWKGNGRPGQAKEGLGNGRDIDGTDGEGEHRCCRDSKKCRRVRRRRCHRC